MIATHKSIQGEVYSIMQCFHLPFCKMYSKTFHSRKFTVAVAKQLQNNLEHRTVTLAETDDDYILRVE